MREPPDHLKLLGDGRKMFAELDEILIVRMQDVAAVPVNKIGNGSDFAFGIRAGDEKDG